MRGLTVFSLQILIGGDFRIIDGEKILSRVRRPLVGSGQALVVCGRGSTPILGLVNFDFFHSMGFTSFKIVSFCLKLY